MNLAQSVNRRWDFLGYIYIIIIVNLIISRKSFVYVNTKRFWTLTSRPTKIAEFIIGGHNVHSCTRFLRSNLNLVCCWWAYCCQMWFSRAKVMYNSMISSTWCSWLICLQHYHRVPCLREQLAHHLFTTPISIHVIPERHKREFHYL